MNIPPSERHSTLHETVLWVTYHAPRHKTAASAIVPITGDASSQSMSLRRSIFDHDGAMHRRLWSPAHSTNRLLRVVPNQDQVLARVLARAILVSQKCYGGSRGDGVLRIVH